MTSLEQLTQSYAHKTDDYFRHSRRDQLRPLLPARAPRVLEVGCGAGTTLEHLKASGFCEWTAGVELFPAAAARAREVVDLVYEGNIETLELAEIAPGSLDLILCLDVLEHLVDPWHVVARLRALLRPGGLLIASLPNVQHHTVVLPLLLRGEWSYGPFGLLDRTHLRFFTHKTAVALLASSGMQVEVVLPVGLAWTFAKRLARLVTFGRLDGLLTFQYLLRARNPVTP
jgi:2-polyprenyl-3-methyl-5-hydroxy-6-metoxy-1,4-benzoquinol methylase